jgi:hypothetical protein
MDREERLEVRTWAFRYLIGMSLVHILAYLVVTARG